MIDYGLKPCPFCGQDANKAITHVEIIPTGILALEINCCMLHILETSTINCDGVPYPKENLIDVWNNRRGEGKA